MEINIFYMISKIKKIIPYKKKIKSCIFGFVDTLAYFINNNKIQSIDLKNIRTVNFICYGNICRSPFAEEYMRKKLKEKNINIEVFSTGFFDKEGRIPPIEAITAAKQWDISLLNHRSKKINNCLVDKSSIIIGMEYANFKQFKKIFSINNSIYLLKHFLWSKYIFINIKDPYGKSIKDFIKCYTDIVCSVDELIKQIENL